MKTIAILTAAAALVALTGCDRLGIGGGGDATANETANAASGNSAAGAGGKDPAGGDEAQAGGGGDLAGGGTPAAAGAITPNRAYIAGRWTDDGNCAVAVEFAPDGRFITHDGGGGLWHLQGDRLTMTGERTLQLQIVPIDQNTMNVVNPDGSLGRSTRC